MATIVISLIIVAMSLAALGPLVLWSKISNIGDALSHTIIFSLVLNYFSGISLTICSVIVAVIFVLILEYSSRDKRIDNSSKIVILTCLSISMTVLISDFSAGKIRLQEFLVGDPFAITISDLFVSGLVFILICIFICYKYNEIVILTISSDLAEVKGINIRNLNLSIKLILAVTISLMISIVGVLLMSSLLIIPASIARLISRSPWQMILFSIIIAAFLGAISIVVSINYDTSYAPTLAFLLSISYFLMIVRGIK